MQELGVGYAGSTSGSDARGAKGRKARQTSGISTY
jgi:hypothetical protein